MHPAIADVRLPRLDRSPLHHDPHTLLHRPTTPLQYRDQLPPSRLLGRKLQPTDVVHERHARGHLRSRALAGGGRRRGVQTVQDVVHVHVSRPVSLTRSIPYCHLSRGAKLTFPNCSVSTLAALALDLSVRRQQTSRGIYRLPDTDVKIPADHRADAFSLGEWYTQKTPREEQSEVLIRSDEYVVPAVQFRYHDTGYYGGSG